MNSIRYLYLPSNGSYDVFPNNTAGDWTTMLEMPMDLSDGKYEVGLAEIQFIRSLPTLTKTTFSVTLPNGSKRNFTLSTSGVASVSDMIEAINTAIPSTYKAYVSLSYDMTTFKAKVSVAKDYKLEIPNEWVNVLGFMTNTFSARGRKKNVEAMRIADLYQGTYNLYVFSNISQPIPVGSKTKPLLGIVSIPKGQRSEPEVVTNTYTTPMFLPVTESYIQTIRIYLTDDIGNPIHFKLEPTTVKLALRKVTANAAAAVIA